MKLIFIYNADSGWLNAAMDAGHKLISPSTYQCSLCALTYGVVSERRAWKRFRKTFRHPMEFHHIDEFRSAYPDAQPLDYPVVLHQTESGTLTTLLSKQQLDNMEDLDQLIAAIRQL